MHYYAYQDWYTAKKLQTTQPQKNKCGHYCELFTCRDGFGIFSLNAQLFS